LKQGVDAHGAGKPVGRPLHGGLGTVSLDFHHEFSPFRESPGPVTTATWSLMFLLMMNSYFASGRLSQALLLDLLQDCSNLRSSRERPQRWRR
jgi:hypothetical protein